MDVTITFSKETVKELTHRLRLAWHQGKLPLVKQLSALLLLADRLPVYTIACRLGVSTTTIYGWRDAFLERRWTSLVRGKSTGRPTKLTSTQRQRLKELIVAGPEAAGYATGCWNAAVLQDLIQREFGQTYHVRYISVLLGNLG